MTLGVGFISAAAVRETDAGKRLIILDADRFRMLVETLKPGPYEIEVRREKQTRSERLNRYYWAVVVKAISEWSGYEVEDVHEFLKLTFNSKILLNVQTGEETKIGASTKHLATEDFLDFLRRCKQWAAEQGLYIPDPNEQ